MCRGWLSRRWLRLVLRLVGEKMAFVGSELACPSFVLSCESFSEKRTFGNRLFWHHSWVISVKIFDAATLILGPSNVR